MSAGIVQFPSPRSSPDFFSGLGITSSVCMALVRYLPRRSCARFAGASKTLLYAISDSLLFLCQQLCLSQCEPEEWHYRGLGARLRTFIDWLPPLIRASERLSEHYSPLWVGWPNPEGYGGKGRGKGCHIDHTEYHRGLGDADRRSVAKVAYESTRDHYANSKK